MGFTNGHFDGAQTLNLSHVGSPSTPRMVVMHYTVTDTVAAARNALNSSNPPLSYHFLVDQDGSIHQTRRPNIHAAHAGRSNWKATSGIANGSSVNRDAVSISFINRGFFEKSSNGFFFDTNAHGNLIGKSYPASEVEVTASIYNPGKKRNWHRFTDRQLDAARELIVALRDEFGIRELVAHDDVAIDGKSDTGPLFPMQELREEFQLMGGLGLRTTVKAPGDGFASLRRRPSASSEELARIDDGTEIRLRSVVYTHTATNALLNDGPQRRYLTRWASVDVEGNNSHSGFMHMGLLTKRPLTAALEARI